MAKYLVETFYTCTFKVSHYLDKIDEKELENLEKKEDGKFEILDMKIDNRKTKNLDKNLKTVDNLNDKEKFSNFIRTQTSFNQGNMFVTKSKKIMDSYYKVLFEWLRKCEDIFGFNLDGYGKTRIYAFLAERFLSYWFKENTNYLEWPIMFHDIRK